MMPLIYDKALDRWNQISKNEGLRDLEISGFVKCIARGKCINIPDNTAETIVALKKSVEKQFNDWLHAADGVPSLEALADLRNSCGLLFLELENKDE